MVDLRAYSFIDVLRPQVASFLGTVAQGYLPVEEQAALVVEIAPGIEINRATDFALKRTGVQPGMLIVERAFGLLEVHSYDQGDVRAAGQAILGGLGLREEDRLRPRVLTQQVITGIDPHHAMLLNRMRHGQMILKGEALLILELEPAGYAIIAANEAEKAAPVNVLEVIAFGAFGRVFLGGLEQEIAEAARAIESALSSLGGRELQKK